MDLNKNDKVAQLVEKIKSLEAELELELHEKFENFNCEITQKREELRAIYKRDKENWFVYLMNAPVLYVLSVPIIWACLIPAFFLDIVVSLYQATCFPIYKISKVKRSDYIIVDRHKLGYLNIIEKANCWYCSYFNGLLGYVSEIGGRTEQFWCPIRHSARVKSMHEYYKNFVDYGNSKEYRQNQPELRKELE
ncbi:MAG: hypothetical protein PHE73_08020 [Sulfurovaceae bacterium]|nr:hypothetical protein [Sulfurovaceae bacterium]